MAIHVYGIGNKITAEKLIYTYIRQKEDSETKTQEGNITSIPFNPHLFNRRLI